jgi:hypothetical protein
MILLWLILATILSFVALHLAKRSLKDFQDTPHQHLKYSLYLIRSPSRLTSDFLHEFSIKAKGEEVIFSLERLFKGKNTVLIIYAPKDLIEQFDYLNLQELEDYTQKVDINNCLAWEIEPKQKMKGSKSLLKTPPTFLKNLPLRDEDQFYFQMVCQLIHQKKERALFQVTLRGLAIADDPIIRTNIAKKVETQMERETKSGRRESSKSSSQLYHDYKSRSIRPREVSQFILTGEDVIALLTH